MDKGPQAREERGDGGGGWQPSGWAVGALSSPEPVHSTGGPSGSVTASCRGAGETEEPEMPSR